LIAPVTIVGSIPSSIPTTSGSIPRTVELADDTAALGGAPFTLEPAPHPTPFATGPRVGVSGDGGTDAFPLRFWIPGDPTVSVYRAHTPKKRR
jgi:DNA-3-methyladenine glycosylase